MDNQYALLLEQIKKVSHDLEKLKDEFIPNNFVKKGDIVQLDVLLQRFTGLEQTQKENLQKHASTKVEIDALKKNYDKLISSVENLGLSIARLEEHLKSNKEKLDSIIDTTKVCVLPQVKPASETSQPAKSEGLIVWFKSLPAIVQIGAALGTVSWIIYKIYAVIAPHFNLPM